MCRVKGHIKFCAQTRLLVATKRTVATRRESPKPNSQDLSSKPLMNRDIVDGFAAYFNEYNILAVSSCLFNPPLRTLGSNPKE